MRAKVKTAMIPREKLTILLVEGWKWLERRPVL